MQYIVNRSQIHHHAAALLQAHLRLRDFGRACPARTLLAVVFAACCRLSSLAGACARLLLAPSRETLRQALLANLPALAELERCLNRALAADLPRALRRRPQRLAADLTLVPYHGLPYREAAEIYRSLAKHGTSHFHAYATLYVAYRGQRFTAALTGVQRGEALEAVLRRLLRRAAGLGLRVRLLLVDRGFFSVGVIRYLQAARYPFLMPVALRGRRLDDPRGPSGTRVFLTWPRSGWGRYTLTAKGGRTAAADICVRCRNYAGQWGRHGRQRLVYAFWGLVPPSTEWVRQTYRLRFGIEASYRQLHQGRARTCSRNPAVRLFLVGVALLLRNVWVWLHYAVLSAPRRGGRRLNPERLSLKDLLLMLLHMAEEELGTIDMIASERPPE
jgi:Transposase DDE domain